MSSSKGIGLILAAGCAAMVGAAVVAVSLGAFFSDLPAGAVNAASASAVPVKVVKTMKVTSAPSQSQDRPKVVAASKGPAESKPAASTTGSIGAVDDDALHQADPRWARSSAATSNSSGSRQQQIEQAFADEPPRTAADRAASDELGAQSDPFAMMTGENSDIDLAPNVANVPSPAPRGRSVERQEAAPQASGRSITVNAAVNMRSAPRSGSGVLMVVPAGSRVSVGSGCEHWCQITYNGRRGYVYRDFVGGSAPKRTKTRVARNSQPQTPEGQQTEQVGDPGLFGNPGTFGAAKGVTAMVKKAPVTSTR